MKTKTYKQGDSEFMFSADGITLTPRASIEITSDCPSEYKYIIINAYNNGWIKLVANAPKEEHFIEELTK